MQNTLSVILIYIPVSLCLWTLKLLPLYGKYCCLWYCIELKQLLKKFPCNYTSAKVSEVSDNMLDHLIMFNMSSRSYLRHWPKECKPHFPIIRKVKLSLNPPGQTCKKYHTVHATIQYFNNNTTSVICENFKQTEWISERTNSVKCILPAVQLSVHPPKTNKVHLSWRSDSTPLQARKKQWDIKCLHFKKVALPPSLL